MSEPLEENQPIVNNNNSGSDKWMNTAPSISASYEALTFNPDETFELAACRT
jgi:hypothetical protein